MVTWTAMRGSAAANTFEVKGAGQGHEDLMVVPEVAPLACWLRQAGGVCSSFAREHSVPFQHATV